jgi:hypothetical protein
MWRPFAGNEFLAAPAWNAAHTAQLLPTSMDARPRPVDRRLRVPNPERFFQNGNSTARGIFADLNILFGIFYHPGKRFLENFGQV